MKLFSAFHNPKTKWYTTYYVIVLIAVTGTVLAIPLAHIHLNPIQGIMTFFEGFFSLFMLFRSESVKKSLKSHLSIASSFIKK